MSTTLERKPEAANYDRGTRNTPVLSLVAAEERWQHDESEHVFKLVRICDQFIR